MARTTPICNVSAGPAGGTDRMSPAPCLPPCALRPAGAAARTGRSLYRRAARILPALLALAPLPAYAATPDLLAYLQARAAAGDNAPEFAARRFADALAATPDDATVATDAYREALVAGDLALAARAADALGPAAPADAALLAVADAAARGDLAAADAAIARLGDGRLAIFAAPLAAWAAFARGTDPLPLLAAARDDAVARRFATETRALILIAQGHEAEGLATLRATLGFDQSGEDMRVAAARLLIGMGRVAAARGLLAGDAPPLVALRKRPGEGAKPGLAFGAATLFTRVASDLALGPPDPLPLALAQAAVHADPTNDRARLLLAYTLARAGVAARALDTLAAISPDSPYAAMARAGRIQVLSSTGRADEALAEAEAAATGSNAPDDALQRFADLLMVAERPHDAVPVYRKLIDRAGRDAGWSAWMQYGGALDEAGDWPRAHKALQRAVALAPDEPAALNYLGYAQIVHGEPVGPAAALLERASRLRPDDAAITDSLGWAYHLAGRTGDALPLLERAAAASPESAEIGEHLGDAYWALGRRYEARYAWRAAQVVAEPAGIARLAAKIADGPQR